MWFFAGIVLFIFFAVFCYFFVKNKINRLTMKYLGTTDIKSVIEQARIEDEDVPKSLPGMDSIYIEQIMKDFPDVNVNELKRMCEMEIIDCYRAIEKKNSSKINNGKIKSFVNSMIDDIGNDTIRYDDFKIHRTVISKYEKSGGIATLYFATSFQYIYKKNNDILKKVQDRVKCEYIYVYDLMKVDSSKKVLGLNCPNCGSPITELGHKNCSYCGTKIIDVISKVWNINDIVRY